MAKRLLTLLLSITLLTPIASAHDFEVNGIYYDKTGTNPATVAVTYRGSSYNTYSNEYSGSVVIPPTVTYSLTTYSVTSIDDYAFWGCSGLTSITIPNSVTSIGGRAFYGCSGLTSVHISDIAAWCNISFSSYDANPLMYAHHLFLNNSEVTNLVIPNSVTSIGYQAFYGCSGLTSVTIPNSVTSIGGGAFYGCSGLTDVVWNAKSCRDFYYSYSSDTRPFQNCPNISSFTFGDEVKRIPAYLCYCMSKLTSVTIGNSVTSIGEGAFRGCSGLTSVTIGNSVTSIGDFAFYVCSSLTSVHISDIAAWCNISFSSYDANPLIYAHHLFLNNSEVTNLVIPNSVTKIGVYAFQGCSGLTSVTIGNSVTSIGGSAFEDCSGLTSVTIPNSVTSIGGGAFYGCSGLTSLTIGNSVTSIGNGAFRGCSGLTSVTIPNSVTSIGSVAFCECSGLTSVKWNAVECCDFSYDSYVFNGANSINSFEFGNTVKKIPAYLCYNMKTLTDMTIPNSVTSIGSSAFSGCSGLTDLVWNAVNCSSTGGMSTSNIERVTIGNNVEVLPSYFVSGSKITSVTIPDSVTTIGEYAFYNCSGLTSVTIPNSVTSIGDFTFWYCI